MSSCILTEPMSVYVHIKPGVTKWARFSSTPSALRIFLVVLTPYLLHQYRRAENFGEDLNLAIWRILGKTLILIFQITSFTHNSIEHQLI